MRTYTFLALLLLLTCNASAQHEGTAFEAMVERVARFGNRIPQEKVYVHMDNTSYLQGDTIWFKAYLRRTDTDKPSRVSNTLYVELRDPDGYLKERKQIWMTGARGSILIHRSKKNGFSIKPPHVISSGTMRNSIAACFPSLPNMQKLTGVSSP